MEKVTKFNRENLREMRNLIDAKFAEIEKETGVKLSIGNITFDGTSFTSKVSAKIYSVVTSNMSDRELKKLEGKMNLKKFGRIHGLSESDYGKVIVVDGDKMTIIGCTARRGKYTVIVENSKGKVYRVTNTTALRQLELTK